MNILQHNSQDIINNLGQVRDFLRGKNNDPLTMNTINGLPYPDQGVKGKLNSAYQEYQQNLHNIGQGQQGQRLRDQAKTACREAQLATIESYRNQCIRWRQKNARWSAAYALRLKPQPQQQQQQQPTLEQEVQQYLVTIQQQMQQPIGPQRDNGIRIGHLNARSLLTRDLFNGGRPDKFDNLQIILRAHGFHFFVVGESWVKGVDSQLLAIPGYNLVGRLDRDYPGPRFNHGGLLVYVRGNVAANVVRQDNVLVPGANEDNPSSLLQYILVKLTNFPNDQQDTFVSAVYNPPFGGHRNAMLTLNNQGNPNGGVLQAIHNQHDNANRPSNLVIIGDINIDILGNQNQAYQNAFGQLGFQNCIWEETRNGTLLDHIYFKQGNNIPEGQRAYILESGVIPPGDGFQLGGFADHKIIYCTVGNLRQQDFQTPQNRQPHRFHQQPQRKQQELNNSNYNNALNLNWV